VVARTRVSVTLYVYCLSCFMHDVSCFMYDVSCFMYDVSCFMYDVSCFMHDVSCFMYDVSCFMYDVSCFRKEQKRTQFFYFLYILEYYWTVLLHKLYLLHIFVKYNSVYYLYHILPQHISAVTAVNSDKVILKIIVREMYTSVYKGEV
jgi:hypothetical protein